MRCSIGWNRFGFHASLRPRRDENVHVDISSAAGFLIRFPRLGGGDGGGDGKPAPDFFLLAAARLDIEPVHCIVLEDSEPGVRGAINAGMIPIVVPDMLAPPPDLLACKLLVLPSLINAHPHLAARPR